MTTRHRVQVAVAAVAAASLLAATAGCGDDPGGGGDRVKIGFLASLSGTYQSVGTDMRAGFELYLSTHGGKLGGRPVELVVADEGDGSATAVPAATKLIKKDRVVALAGLSVAARSPGSSPLPRRARSRSSGRTPAPT